MERDSLTIGVTNTFSDIPRANKRISAFCSERNVPAKLLNRFSLSLDEVLTNIITHASVTMATAKSPCKSASAAVT
jgi:anti-sigma regulatory factor (Ser/Thr protein kinase)